MAKELTCNQVCALLNFYVENKLNPRLKASVEEHLKTCIYCRRKAQELRKILSKYSTNNSNYIDNEENSQLLNSLKLRLSEYMDNELNTNDNLKIKKASITNPIIRKELETMYKLKKIMLNAYEKTQNEARFDYSKKICSTLQGKTDYTTTYFYRLAAVFVVLIGLILSCFVYLYF